MLCVFQPAVLQCSVSNLPVFEDTSPRRSPDRDQFQAIVPDYVFRCSGRVTEWGACVQPGGSFNIEQYYIQFQVWAPTKTSGCYRLVGSNTPMDAVVPEEYLVPPDNDIALCVVLTVREEEQIVVEPGYVVGYYVDYFRNDEDRDNGGVQWIEDGNIMIYYSDEVSRNELKSYYAINGRDPNSCGFEISFDEIDSYSLTVVTSATPIISVKILASTATETIIWQTTSSSTTVDHSSPAVTTTPAEMSTPPIIPNISFSPPPGEDPAQSKPTASSTIIAITGSLLVLLVVTASGFSLVLLCVRKRKKGAENLVQSSHEVESDADMQTDPAYDDLNVHPSLKPTTAAVLTAPNPAYISTTAAVLTAPNPAHISTTAAVLTPPNPAYTSTTAAVLTPPNPAYTSTTAAVLTPPNPAHISTTAAVLTAPNLAHISTTAAVLTPPNPAYTSTTAAVLTPPNPAYTSTTAAVLTPPNPAYTSTTAAVLTASNPAYISTTTVPTAPNPAYISVNEVDPL